MKKEKVPRLKIIDGRNTKIYQKYGWIKGNKHFNEYDEIINKYNFIAQQKVKSKYLDLLKKISYDYETKFLKEVLN